MRGGVNNFILLILYLFSSGDSHRNAVKIWNLILHRAGVMFSIKIYYIGGAIAFFLWPMVFFPFLYFVCVLF